VQRYAPGIELPKGVAETVEHVVRAERKGPAATRALTSGGAMLRLPAAGATATANLTTEGQ
jgi:hypothetical protein